MKLLKLNLIRTKTASQTEALMQIFLKLTLIYLMNSVIPRLSFLVNSRADTYSETLTKSEKSKT